MNVDKINASIRRQVGDWHKRRHPSKGVVVEEPGFQEAVDRRTRILKALTRHKAEMPFIMKRVDRVNANRRRWVHIRRAVLMAKCPVAALTIQWQNNVPVGYQISTVQGTTTHGPEDRDALQNLWVETSDGFVVFHALTLLEENFQKMGVTLPKFVKSIDTAQVGNLMVPRSQEHSPSSLEVGTMLGVNRGDFEDHGQFLLAVLDAMVVKEDLFPR